MWIGADEALSLLGVKPQTLYASVSRGRIRAKADPRDPRRSLYHQGDVAQAAARLAGRRPAAVVAEAAIGWGEPVLHSAITTIVDGRLFYRGADVAALAASASFEEVAARLWQIELVPRFASSRSTDPLFVALARRAENDLPALGRSRPALILDAMGVVAGLAGAIAPGTAGDLASRLATGWGRPDARAALSGALVLLADHELNASTFAARVAVSTGASLAAGALAGLAALSGPLHGSAATPIRALMRQSRDSGIAAAIKAMFREGRVVPAMGHPLYPEGDIRAKTLLGGLAPDPHMIALGAALEEACGEPPNIDFALAVLCEQFALPESAPFDLFALARSVGWCAHMIEQIESGHLIRPRARYVGPAPSH